MKKLITFSAILIGISIVFNAVEHPLNWKKSVDKTQNSLTFQTNELPKKGSELIDIETRLSIAETPNHLTGLTSTCVDSAGTVTRTLSGGVAAPTVYPLCWGNDYIITHDGNADFSGDGDPTTPAGLDLMIFTDSPTVSGSLVADIALNPGYTGNIVGTNPAGSITLTNLGTYQNFYGTNAQGYTSLWFAPVTIDDVTSAPKTLSEDIGGANECVHVSVSQAFQIVFLDSIHIDNITTPVNGNTCQASFDVSGGLMAYDNNTYTVTIEDATNPTITGTVITGSTLTHNGQVTFTVPQAGTYNLNVSDGCTTKTVVVNMSSCASTCAGFAMGGGVTSNYNGEDISCSSASDGSIGITPTGGNYPYTYTWSHDVTLTDSNATSLSAGSYTVTVTDANGCNIDTTITLVAPSPLFIGVIGGNPLCSGDSTGLVWVGNIGGGTLPYSYTWSNGVVGPNDTIFNLGAGSYGVTVTDANGCTATASTSIGDPPALNGNFTAVSNATCDGINDGDAIISATGGSPTYNYSWAHDAALTIDTATNLGVGTYYVTVTDNNGCTYEDSVVIGATLSISATQNVTDVNCYGGSDGAISLTPQTSGGAPNLPYSYNWNPNTSSTTNNAAGLTAGNYAYTITDNVGCVLVDSATVNQPDSIVITNISASDVLCNGDTTGIITVLATNGAGGYTYDWGNLNTGATLINVGAGSYTVTVTDANSCVDSLTINLSQPPAIITTQTITDVSCNGLSDGTAAISATGGSGVFAFSWSTNLTDTLATVSGLSAGQYFVTVTDSSGCSIIDTVDITEPESIAANISSTPLSCFNINDGTAIAAPTGGTAPYTFNWSDGSTTAIATGLSSGSIQVTITDFNNCTALDTIDVNSPPAITSTLTTTPVSCQNGTDGTAMVTGAGGSGVFNYTWSNGQIGQSITGLSQGIYTVTISDATGCSIIDTANVVELPPLTGNIIANPVNCFGGDDGSIEVTAMTGGTAPYTYNWSTNPAQDSAVAVNLAAGVYTLTVTDANGCTFGPVNVTVNEPAAAISVTTNIINPSCNGEADGSISVDAIGGTPSYAYLWNDGQNTQTASGLAVGTYEVIVTDAKGCTDTIAATLTEPNPLDASLLATETSCNGVNDGRIIMDTIIGGTAPYVYSIDGFSFQPTDIIFFGLTGGNYDVTVRDGNGCLYEETILVSEPPLIVVDLGADVVLELGNSMMLEAIVNTTDSLTYTWASNPGDSSMSCMDCPTPIIAPVTTTTYTVTVEDTSGCTATDQILVQLDKNRNVFIPNVFTPNGDGRNDEFYVYAGTGVERIKTFLVYDRWGSKLYEATNVQPNDASIGWDGKFRGQDVQAGVYVFFIEIEFADGIVFPYKGDLTLIR